MLNKPSGDIGPIKITYNSSQIISKLYEKIVWKKDQQGIEEQILQFFIRDNSEGKKFLCWKSGGTEELGYKMVLRRAEIT